MRSWVGAIETRPMNRGSCRSNHGRHADNINSSSCSSNNNHNNVSTAMTHTPYCHVITTHGILGRKLPDGFLQLPIATAQACAELRILSRANWRSLSSSRGTELATTSSHVDGARVNHSAHAPLPTTSACVFHHQLPKGQYAKQTKDLPKGQCA